MKPADTTNEVCVNIKDQLKKWKYLIKKQAKHNRHYLK